MRGAVSDGAFTDTSDGWWFADQAQASSMRWARGFFDRLLRAISTFIVEVLMKSDSLMTTTGLCAFPDSDKCAARRRISARLFCGIDGSLADHTEKCHTARRHGTCAAHLVSVIVQASEASRESRSPGVLHDVCAGAWRRTMLHMMTRRFGTDGPATRGLPASFEPWSANSPVPRVAGAQ